MPLTTEKVPDQEYNSVFLIIHLMATGSLNRMHDRFSFPEGLYRRRQLLRHLRSTYFRQIRITHSLQNIQDLARLKTTAQQFDF